MRMGWRCAAKRAWLVLAMGLLGLAGSHRVQSDPLPQGARVDLVLVLDKSQTMRPMFEAVQDAFWRLVGDALQADLELDLQVGMVLYGHTVRGDETDPRPVLHPLTLDLDALIGELDATPLAGGREYLGRALNAARLRMRWREGAVRAIVIVGNESPRQDPETEVEVAAARCQDADIQVHTLYCGREGDAFGPMWRDVATQGGGRFDTFDYRHRSLSIPSPFERRVYELVPRLLQAWVPRRDAKGLPSPTDPERGADRALVLALQRMPSRRVTPKQAHALLPEHLPETLRALEPRARAKALRLRHDAFEAAQNALLQVARERKAWRAKHERATPASRRAHARLGALLRGVLPGMPAEG